ncbi:MAG TPA: substrate-binding domain-containing protein [Eoetvoesiella sp.]
MLLQWIHETGDEMRDIYVKSVGAANGLFNRLAGNRSEHDIGVFHIEFGAANLTLDRARNALCEGEKCDLIVLTTSLLNELKLEHGDRISSDHALGTTVTGLAKLIDSPAPDMRSEDAVKQALLSADKVFVPDLINSTGGRQFASMLESLRLTQLMEEKLKQFPGGVQAVAALRDEGTASSIACAQMTEIATSTAVMFIGGFPDSFALSTAYSIAVVGQNPKATLLIEYFKSADGKSLLENCGFQ